jgi:hypothetical protein
VVECDLAKVEVAGSNPVSRSSHYVALAFWRGFFAWRSSEGCGTQVVKGKVCKTFIRRFDSDPHLQIRGEL